MEKEACMEEEHQLLSPPWGLKKEGQLLAGCMDDTQPGARFQL